MLLCVLLMWPDAAGATGGEDQIGFVATVISVQQIGEEASGDAIYARRHFKVRLRAEHVLSDGRPIEFDAEIVTNFDTAPRRIFVVIDSEKSKNLVYWTEVSDYFCIGPDAAKTLDLDALNLTPVTVKGAMTPCFTL